MKKKVIFSFTITANAQLRVDYIPHAKGHYLAVNGYRYVVKTKKQGRDAELIYWKCAVQNCPGTANTKDNVVTRFPVDHNHPPSRADIDAKKFLGTMREKARKTLDPLPDLYDNELVQLRNREWDNHTQEVVEKIPTFVGTKSSLYRERLRELPPLPATRNAINLQDKWRETTTGDQFLLADDGDNNKILVFGTADNLRHLSNANTIFGDGTFYASPVLFKQLYTLHALIDNDMYPLIFPSTTWSTDTSEEHLPFG